MAKIEHTERGAELVTDDGLRLHLDFVNDRLKYQRPHRGKSELIAKAIGLSKGFHQVWDLTAGLAEDAWFLVRLGAEVTAFERQPLIAELVEDARQRAARAPETAELAARFSLRAGDAIEILRALQKGSGPEVIYLDPMFSFEKKKTALPRKEMQIFRSVVGADADASDLLREALRVAKDRVVVKRPLKEPPLLEGLQHRFEGTTIRYDLYNPKL
ncbi:MAG: class I SAM-dependent methyltransferase [Bdellovibrionaceae bacterium]|nr:class I SAM-dependent methyltransferase [Pseudobdellovibrionaceae bacterium]